MRQQEVEGWAGALAVLLLLTLLAMPAGVALRTASASPLFHSVGNVTSSNWAGFAVTSTANSVTDVKGSWVQPKIVGTCGVLATQYSSFWVGIDGYSSTTVEQIGTEADCVLGTTSYYAWYEFYPNPSHTISSLTITPGDKIFGEVSWTGTQFNLTLKDTTTTHSFSITGKVTGASRDSAEWIAEAPSTVSGVLPLADFGVVYWGHVHTGIRATCTATIGGVTGSLTAFSNIHRITMVTISGNLTKAAPNQLGKSGLGFSVIWASSGP
ncbi:MAG: G1 family endopeptidase [Thermoplasmata archaeon]|nr:G1 family endopeptidase [Thermoplasmata archaeon]